MSNDYSRGWAHLGERLGIGFIILCLCFGIGGCNMMIKGQSPFCSHAPQISNVSTNQ